MTGAQVSVPLLQRVDTWYGIDIMRLSLAGVAQLVERNLAKVEVASSRLVSRSRIPGKTRFRIRNRVFPF